jgi:hypothetical protein
MKAIASLFLAALFLFAPSLRAADGALEFNPASDQRVEVPNFAGLGISTEVTVEFWVLSTSNSIAQSVFMLNPDTPTNRFQSHVNQFIGNIYWDFDDFDGGGQSNQAGWLALSSAANGSSRFTVTLSSISGGQLNYSFPSALGRNYTVEYSTDLTTPWQTAPGTITGTGTGSGINATIGPVIGFPRFFLRVRASLP